MSTVPIRVSLWSAVAAVLAAGALALPATAQASSFAGSCQIAGPIVPKPPITVVPRPGAHFSFAGTGACDGTLDGVAVHAAPATILFENVATLFDTCELGPDFDLHGLLGIGAARFAIRVDLARLALVGPLFVSTPGGGLALGVGQFAPGDPATALRQCLAGGVAAATLTASFRTLRPLR